MYKFTNYTDEAFVEYKNKLMALLPIDSDEKAKEYMRLFKTVHHWDESKKLLDFSENSA